MYIRELYEKLNFWYPQTLSCEWDHDGIMCLSSDSQIVKRVLVVLDVTDEVVSHAIDHHFDTIISHHPLLFSPIDSLDIQNPIANRLIRCILNGISILSFHTRMDAAPYGVNDALAQALQLQNIENEANFIRIGTLAYPMTDLDFLSHLQKCLNVHSFRYHFPQKEKKLHRIAVCGGSGKDFLKDALLSNADAYVTGELSYHLMLDNCKLPMALIACGHSHTEIPICDFLKQRLTTEYPEIFVASFIEYHTF